MSKKKNILWIICDQMRTQMLSIHNDVNIHTPNIDMLARTGVDFIGAVGGCPLCCPYRGSMLTSIYPHNCVPGHEFRLPAEQKTVAHYFNDAGYHTAYIGKWHVDGFHESTKERAAFHIVPTERRGGFQYWMGYENNNSQYDCWVHGGENDDQICPTLLKGYETDMLSDLMLEYLKKRKEDDQPFFSVLSVQPPHDPYIAPEETLANHSQAEIHLRPNVPPIPFVQENARRDLAGAYAMVENLDLNVGRVISFLRDNNMLRDTYVFFFSDHGDMHGSHGMLRKTNPFEESIRVPFIISGGDPIYYGGRRLHLPVNHVDLAPTSLGLCGLPIPPQMEGTDYSTCLHAQKKPDLSQFPDSAYIELPVPTGHEDSTDKAWRGLVTRDGWKYVCFENVEWLLYNLNEDPYEFINHAHNSVYLAKRRELNARLRKWTEDTRDTFAVPKVVDAKMNLNKCHKEHPYED